MITISTPYKGPSPRSPGRLVCLQDRSQSDEEALPEAWREHSGCGVCTGAVAAITYHHQGGQPRGLEESPLCAGLEQQVPGSQELPLLPLREEHRDDGRTPSTLSAWG